MRIPDPIPRTPDCVTVLIQLFHLINLIYQRGGCKSAYYSARAIATSFNVCKSADYSERAVARLRLTRMSGKDEKERNVYNVRWTCMMWDGGKERKHGSGVWCEMKEERENMAAVDSAPYSADPGPCDAIFHDAISCDAISRDTISRNAISCDAISRDAISRDAISRDLPSLP